jgi:predicted nucleotidyltransferase component of viral defense system
LARRIAFRGATAIHKLLFKRPLRYSEDVDLVQVQPKPIGGTVDAMRAALSWLRKFSRKQAGHSMHQVFLEKLALTSQKVIACFDRYLALEGKPITRAMAEQRMLEKLTRSLTEDVVPMLLASVRWSDALQAFERV